MPQITSTNAKAVDYEKVLSYHDEVMELDRDCGLLFRSEVAEIAARADAEIESWRLRAEQAESALGAEDARIAELVELLTECRDCVSDCLNAEQNRRHSRAERADYYAGLLAQVDATSARAGNGGEG